MNKYNWQQQIQ